jgi:cbb3-type cytochrome oxidase maturation protein
VIAAGFLGAFIWAVRSGQYEDTCTPSLRLLLRDTAAQPQPQPIQSTVDVAASKNTPAPAESDCLGLGAATERIGTGAAVAKGQSAWRRVLWLSPRKKSNP